jgi:RNA polymerase sigma factor (TIGR02999 family)
MSEASFTLLLEQWGTGDAQALEALMPIAYAELRRLAMLQMRRERATHTLQPTALVHEAFLRLAGQNVTAWRSRGQFFGLASQLMRRILVDHARRRLSGKRGGGELKLTLDELESELESGAEAAALGGTGSATPERLSDLLALDTALRQLEAVDARQARIVELRFFAGLTIEEIAALLRISHATIKRDWIMARAWLTQAMSGPQAVP